MEIDLKYPEQKLAWAVIEQAIIDAEQNVDNYDRQSARRFLCAKSDYYKRCLAYWCMILGADEEVLISKFRKRFGKK